MVLVAPQQATDAPSRVPAPYGLFTAVTPAPPSAVRWENGLVWRDGQCGALPAVITPDCTAPAGVPLTFTQGQAPGEALAFTVYGDFLCSPVSWTPERAQQAALARLLAREEEHVGVQLVSYLRTTAGGALQGTSVATSSDTSTDLGKLESSLAVDYGSRGLVLASLAAFYSLWKERAIDVQGNTLYTGAGTPVALVRTTIAGFSLGIVPAPLIVRGSPFSPDSEPANLFHHQQNDLYAAAMRSYAAGWTTGCGAAYIT